MGTRGMVASSQPLASEAGMRILQKGGNAADAAVAVAAALNMTEPCSTGIGGDAFCLYFDAKTKKVSAMLGNGGAPGALTLQKARELGVTAGEFEPFSALTVTVPGAAAAWEDTVKMYGKLTLKEVLQPAIELGEGGFPVSPITAYYWGRGAKLLKDQGGSGIKALLQPDGSAPKAGQLQKNPHLASTFRSLAEHGAEEGFYKGRVAEAIVAAIQERGGVMTKEDLSRHKCEHREPIMSTYRGYHIYEVAPPTAGIVALLGLNILEADPDHPHEAWGSSQHLHTAIESLRLAFADGLQHNADHRHVKVPVFGMADKQYAARRRKNNFKPQKAAKILPGNPSHDVELNPDRAGTDTVYFGVVDGEGNACSFINSNYMGFGTGIVPEGCGFVLQNRGYNFILDEKHPNCVAPYKRPYHTIIPGLATDPNGDLFCTFGVMGGFMQPQGHLQVLSNMIDYGMEPQAALNAPRFSIEGVDSAYGPACVEHSHVALEEGFSQEAVAELEKRGHKLDAGISGHARGTFGRGQIIQRNPKTGVLWGGTDPRADGAVMAW